MAIPQGAKPSSLRTNMCAKVVMLIATLDCCVEALNRQKCLIEKAGFDSKQVKHYKEDLCNIDKCVELVTKESPYYLIFLANCLTELKPDVATELVGRLPAILADDGAIIIAEAQRNYIKKLIKTLAGTVEEYGLHVYYPCPATGCPPAYGLYCWVWRYHEYDFPPIKVNGQPLQEEPRDKLILSWLILSRQNVSIYDTLVKKHPSLLWGPISQCTGTERAVCYGNQSLPFKMDYDVSPRYTRGSIVGLSSGSEVEEYHEM